MPALFNAVNNASNSAFVTVSPVALATSPHCLTVPALSFVAVVGIVGLFVKEL